MWNIVTTGIKNRRVLIGCHVTAGQEHLARWAGVSRQNDLDAQYIDARLCVVPPCFTTLQVLQVSGSAPWVRVVGSTYTLLHREGVREQGLCFHNLALLPGKGLAKHKGCVEGFWVLRTKRAPGLGKCNP